MTIISRKRVSFLVAAAILFVAGCDETPSAQNVQAAEPVVAKQESFARTAPDAGGVERVVIQASGSGPTVQAAIDQAIRLAFEQVNGKSFHSTTANLEAKMTAQVNDWSMDAKASAFADLIVTETKGAVSDFRLLSQQQNENSVDVTIEAGIQKFSKPESANKLRVAVSPIRTLKGTFVIGDSKVRSSDVSGRIGSNVAQALTKGKRVTVLDREFSQEIQNELGRIDADNWQNEDYLRLGQQLATDYLVVGRIERFEYLKHSRKVRNSDKVVVSYSGGAALTVKVINAATGQVEIDETIDVALPATKPTTMSRGVESGAIVADLEKRLAAIAADKISLALFPITVVAVDGEDVVFSQGGNVVSKGQVYEVVLRGREITDPQTGQVIGRIEKPCCTVLVTKVTPEMSYGVIKTQEIDDVAAVFAPGALEVRGAITKVVVATSPAPAQPANTPPPAPQPRAATVEPNPAADDDADW